MKDRPASLLVEIQPFCVRTASGEYVLCDTGLGYTNESGNLQLHEHLRSRGIVPEQITRVLLTHLHFDHTGGSVMQVNGKLVPSFPNAVYYVQHDEYEKAISGQSSSYRKPILEALHQSGRLELLQGNGHITDEIAFEISGGHTEFHQVYTITTADGLCFFGGDVLPDMYQLMRRFIAKYDFDGKASAAKRIEYGHRSVSQNSTLLFYHSLRIPFAQVQFTDAGFRMREQH